MTVTLHRPTLAAPPRTTGSPNTVSPTPATPALAAVLAVLEEALLLCADADPGALHGRSPAGRAALGLSALARSTVTDLGSDAGVALTDGPGIVVVRDLAAATSRLAAAARAGRAADRAHVSGAGVEAARALLADLRRAVTPAA